jgi:hypothetical protein
LTSFTVRASFFDVPEKAPVFAKIKVSLGGLRRVPHLTFSHTSELLLYPRFNEPFTMISKMLFMSRASTVSDSNKSQDVAKYDVSSKTKTTTAPAPPVKKSKQNKLKGKDLQRKVRAGTEKRMFLAPTAAELAAKREMRERFARMPQSRGQGTLARRERVEPAAGNPRMWGTRLMENIVADELDLLRGKKAREAPWELIPVETLLAADGIEFDETPMEWAPLPPRIIYADEIDFEAAGMRWY